MWARGARSPEAPKDPCRGTTGVTSLLSISIRHSMSSRRMPELPFTSALALRSIMARTISRPKGVPVATQWLRIKFS